jgi:F-type H+-transporting ATPase subunit b
MLSQGVLKTRDFGMQVLQILTQLGANETAIMQFFIFIFAVTFLTVFIFGPFFKAYDQRLKQTKGAEQVASETEDEAKKLEAIYQLRAREINQKVKDIFDTARKQASESVNTLLGQARASAQDMTDKARQQIAAQKSSADKDIQAVAQDVAVEISKKLTGAV